MTKRKDMIDDAILRSGRLEVHIEITLSNIAGSLKILNIKTDEMKKNNHITADVIDRLPEISELAKNYTGAELEGLVKSEASFALARNIDAANLNKNVSDCMESEIKVEWNDFDRALHECVPAFGNKDDAQIRTYYMNGICNWGTDFNDIWNTLHKLLAQTKNSIRTPLMSILVEGAYGSGKTALCAKLASESEFPFVRMISADKMVGLSENQKCAELLKIFKDSYTSPLSVIFIDDIERIIEFTPVGPRFSNSILQTLLLLLRKVPPSPSRLMIIATTAISHLLDDLQLIHAFNIQVRTKMLQHPDEISKVLHMYADNEIDDTEITKISHSIPIPISIKKLLMFLEMTRCNLDDNQCHQIIANDFIECINVSNT